jgi:DNA modification methylase
MQEVAVMDDYRILHGDALTALYTLPDCSVQCVVTSPPYWGLRDYGTARWVGGEAGCDHKPGSLSRVGKTTLGGGTATAGHQHEGYRDVCRKCGARRFDSQIGLEQTPAEYVAHLVEVFGEVWRVLRDDGTLWLNLGDSYAGSGGAGEWSKRKAGKQEYIGQRGHNANRMTDHTYKPKDLCGIPWRVAFALQDAGWYLRSDIIWAKPNPMPESVTDRPTKAHEYLFLLTKRASYFYDAEAIAEPVAQATIERLSQPTIAEQTGSDRANGGAKTNGRMKAVPPRFGGSKYGNSDAEESRTKSGNDYEIATNGKRNARSVWMIATQPYAEAHFAVMPSKLVEPCILAGTSARGCCPACGAPWARVVERTTQPDSSAKGSRFDAGKTAINGNGRTQPGERYVKQTTGWQPTCTCAPADPIPCTVLDTFAGSGTTLAVAVSLGRHGIGIELNASYIELAERRIAAVQRPLLMGL